VDQKVTFSYVEVYVVFCVILKVEVDE